MRWLRPAALALVLWMWCLPATAHESGVAMAGVDSAVVQLPVSALVVDYRNSGYSIAVDGGQARVEVNLQPLASRTPFAPPAEESSDAVSRLARSVTLGSRTQYEAVSRVLTWVASHIAYDLDRKAPQGPDAVLERRSAYCTGVSRLTVAMLDSVGIGAREVAGYVVGTSRGYHRWIEVYYPDRGGVFSDPMSTHHYVPATYVPLASESLLPSPESERGVLIERQDDREVVDTAPTSPRSVTVRRNDDRQHAGALAVTVDGAGEGLTILEGGGARRVRPLVAGRSTFVGVEPGSYRLKVHVEGREAVEKRVVFRDRVRGSVHLPASP